MTLPRCLPLALLVMVHLVIASRESLSSPFEKRKQAGVGVDRGRRIGKKRPKEGLVVIPGLGREDRLIIVRNNLKMLERLSYISSGEGRPWDCIVYVYAAYNNTKFWRNQEDISYISSVCDIVESANGRITENLYMLQPSLIKSTYKRVFILFDDIQLIGKSMESLAFDLGSFVETMARNGLTVASPRVLGANKGGGQQFRQIMSEKPQEGNSGYITCWLEMFAWVMTMPAYTALWDLLYPSVNPYGWGHDFWYDRYAREHVRGHRMGIISSYVVKHVQGEGRAEGSKTGEIWEAVLQQEKVYLSHFGIDLKNHRQNMALKNSSLFGAVHGYVYEQKAVVAPEEMNLVSGRKWGLKREKKAEE